MIKLPIGGGSVAAAVAEELKGAVLLRRAAGTFAWYTGATDAAAGTAILAAQTAAASGDTVLVFRSALLTSALGKDGVNWWFAPGVTISNATTDVWSDGGSAMTFVVDGAANFAATKSGGGVNRVANLTGASTVVLRANNLSATGVCLRIENAGSTLTATFNVASSADGTFDNVTAGMMYLRGRRAVSSANYVLENDGGLIEAWIDEVEGEGSVAPISSNVSGSVVRLYNSRVIAAAGQVCVDVQGGAGVSLTNCVMETDQTHIALSLAGDLYVTRCSRSSGAAVSATLGVGTFTILDGVTAIANGGTGATSASAARTALGLGTMAVRNVAMPAISATGASDRTLLASESGSFVRYVGTGTLYLPAASGNTGVVYDIWMADTAYLVSNGGDIYDAPGNIFTTSLYLTSSFGTMRVISDGTNWYTVAISGDWANI